jgi:hypothetical protein
MSHPDNKPIAFGGEDLWALAEAVCEGTATHEQCDRLSERILADEDVALFYATYLRMHGRMQWNCRHGSTLDPADALQLAADAAVPSAPRSPVPSFLSSIGYPASANMFVSSTSFAYLVAAVLVGLGLLTAALIPVDHSLMIAVKSTDSNGSPAIAPNTSFTENVGRITRTFDCQWTHGVERHEQPGDSSLSHTIQLGERLTVKSGLMEITYHTGATVLLQGPATYRVDSIAGGYLSFGKLTAQLEKRSEVGGQRSESANQQSEIINHRFMVRTPTAVVTDLGTEFGVEVDGHGGTTSHVFRGSVRVETTVVGGNRQLTARVLHANESAQVQKNNGANPATIQTVSLDPARFVRPDELQKISDQDRQAAFRRWNAHSRELRRDPSLMAYYDFQRTDAGQGCPAISEPGGPSRGDVVSDDRRPDTRRVGLHRRADRPFGERERVQRPSDEQRLGRASRHDALASAVRRACRLHRVQRMQCLSVEPFVHRAAVGTMDVPGVRVRSCGQASHALCER